MAQRGEDHRGDRERGGRGGRDRDREVFIDPEQGKAERLSRPARKASPWSITPADFFTETEEVRRLFSALIGADPECIAIMPSASVETFGGKHV